jgi:hypothetical protein
MPRKESDATAHAQEGKRGILLMRRARSAVDGLVGDCLPDWNVLVPFIMFYFPSGTQYSGPLIPNHELVMRPLNPGIQASYSRDMMDSQMFLGYRLPTEVIHPYTSVL